MELNGEFDGVNEDEVEDLKHKYVLRSFVLLTYDSAKVGNAVTHLSGSSAASSLTFRRKLTKDHQKSSVNFMQR